MEDYIKILKRDVDLWKRVSEQHYEKWKESEQFRKNLIILLFGDDYAERVSPDQLTDEKLLEAVRMLKEVY